METSRTAIIKNIYLYLVSFVSLMMITISVANMVDIALKTYVFTKADDNFYYPVAPCAVPSPKEAGISGQEQTTSSLAECAKEEGRVKRQADENRTAQRQQDLVRDISFVVVGIPLFAYHWRVVRKKEEE